jgi:chorismate synthase
VGRWRNSYWRQFDIEIRSHVIQLGGIPDRPLELTFETDRRSGRRCAATFAQIQAAQQRMIELIDQTKREGDTLGGIFEVRRSRNFAGTSARTPRGILKLDGRLAQAVMSIHAVKAVAIGAGFEATSLPGSEVHDEISYNDETREFSRRRTGRAASKAA